MGIVADGELLPFADEQFNLVACHDVLEHVVNPEQLVAEMYRVSGEHVLIAGPNYVGFRYAGGLDRYLPLRALDFLLGQGRGCWRLPDAHLSFDAEWQPDADAITAANSWWVVEEMRRHGFYVTTVETWVLQPSACAAAHRAIYVHCR
jgi:SAM-dependent methyltransferase